MKLIAMTIMSLFLLALPASRSVMTTAEALQTSKDIDNDTAAIKAAFRSIYAAMLKGSTDVGRCRVILCAVKYDKSLSEVSPELQRPVNRPSATHKAGRNRKGAKS